MKARRIPPLLVVACGSVACAHHDDARGGITTIRSGSPEGARVTSVAPDDRAARLAVELCRRAEACGRVGRREARWATDTACVSEVERDVPARLRAWRCSPSSSLGRLEDCLAAIRSARCDAPVDDGWTELAACRAEVVCAAP